MTMDEIQLALRDRYPHIHPLLFHRCLEKSKTNGELFDFLDSMPDEYPVAWDEENRKWVVADLLQRPTKPKEKS